MLKTCTGCDKTKPLDKFPKGRNKCKICRNKVSKKSYDTHHKKKPISDDPKKKYAVVVTNLNTKIIS